jgi:hypothetical protein
MKNKSRLDEIRHATVAAIEKYHARQSAAGNARSRPPRPGDVFLFPGPSAFDLSWVVVDGPHEEGLLFAMPADSHPLIGLTDVCVADSALSGPLVLRCGYGLWLHPDDLGPERLVGVVDERHVGRAREKLAQIAAGKLEGTASQWEAEANPDYHDWLAEVERAADTLASALRVKEEELTAADFSPSVRTSGPVEESAEPELAMAAASSGVLAELYETLARAEKEEVPPARRVDFLYPGELFLTLEADGVTVVYAREGEQPPPELHEISPDGQTYPARWQFTPAGTGARAAFAWRAGQVKLRFGRGEQAREVTVRQ